MKNKSTHATSSASANPMFASPTSLPFVRRFTNAAAVRARFPAPPIGSLVDPYLLDRLQAPLTRYRD
ncbi:MAG TPA: hypothetical protein VIM71_09075 [Lacunisphaera sp.]